MSENLPGGCGGGFVTAQVTLSACCLTQDSEQLACMVPAKPGTTLAVHASTSRAPCHCAPPDPVTTRFRRVSGFTVFFPQHLSPGKLAFTFPKGKMTKPMGWKGSDLTIWRGQIRAPRREKRLWLLACGGGSCWAQIE